MSTEIIVGRHGNQKIQINDNSVSRQHCKLVPNGDGTFTLIHLSQSGTTKIDGREVIQKQVTPDTVLQLSHNFKAKVADLVGQQILNANRPNLNQRASFQGNVNNRPPQNRVNQPAAPQRVSIAHLERVYEEYNNHKLQVAKENKRVGMIRAGSTIFTMGSGLISSLTDIGPLGWVMTGIGLIGIVYSIIGMKNAETPEQRQAIQDQFDDAWACPNCRKSLNAKNYRMLVKNYQHCPHCKCEFVPY